MFKVKLFRYNQNVRALKNQKLKTKKKRRSQRRDWTGGVPRPTTPTSVAGKSAQTVKCDRLLDVIAVTETCNLTRLETIESMNYEIF